MSSLPPIIVHLEKELGKASSTLHRIADQIVNECEAQPALLEEDSDIGDAMRAALEHGRAWRARIEQGI